MLDAGFTFVGEDHLAAPRATVVLPFGAQKLMLRYVARVRGSIVLMWHIQPSCLLPAHAADALVVHSTKNKQTTVASDMLAGGITPLTSGESLLFKTLNAQHAVTRTMLVSHMGGVRSPYLEVERHVRRQHAYV